MAFFALLQHSGSFVYDIDVSTECGYFGCIRHWVNAAIQIHSMHLFGGSSNFFHSVCTVAKYLLVLSQPRETTCK